MTVRELAQRTGVSPYTLRYYEAEGLVPEVVRQANGHRCYNQQHIFWIAFLRRLRATGMTIAEMKEYAELVQQGEGTLSERQLLLGKHRERLQARICELQDSLQLLSLKQRFYAECQRGLCPDDFIAYLASHGRGIDGERIPETIDRKAAEIQK